MKALRLIAWFLIVGLLPFWASIVIVILGNNGRSDYWAAAPWLVLLSIPFCAITLIVAGVTYAVYVATDGGWSRKIKSAAGCFAALSALAIVGVAVFWHLRTA